MTMRALFSVSPGDALPLYRQIVEQVKAAVAAGLLAPGDRLPSHRELAAELLVAPLTVKRAYDLLEEEGLVATRRGLGTFLRPEPRAAGAQAAAELEARLAALVRHARVLGLDEDALHARLAQAWNRRQRTKERR